MKTNELHKSATVAAVDRRSQIWVKAAGVIGFALLTTLGAQIALPLPGTPVPVTFQTFFVLLAGITLGPRLGTASMAFYLVLGTTGYHVLAFGSMGLATAFGSTGGYLIGFILAQPVLGCLAQPRRGFWRGIVPALLAGNLIIFATGLIWLSLWAGADLWLTLALGFWPFLPGLALKTGMAAAAARLVQPVGRRLFG